jgi:DNA-binding MarR family transcriptional regulator
VQFACIYWWYSRLVATKAETASLASDLRVVLGQLLRRLRAEHHFSLSHGSVLGRLDREGTQSVSDLAVSERVRPQSMAQTVADLESDGLVERNPDPTDGRRALVSLTVAGRSTLEADRRHREGWLVKAIEELPPEDQLTVGRAIVLLRRLADADV